MTHEEYHKRIDQSCSDAGASDAGWNDRFLAALETHGLKLVLTNPTPREDWNYYMAPVPFDAGWKYNYPAWIIPKD
jgi:hypothetical protein